SGQHVPGEHQREAPRDCAPVIHLARKPAERARLGLCSKKAAQGREMSALYRLPTDVDKRVRNSVMSSLERTWERVLERVAERVTSEDLTQLIRPLRPVALTPTELRLEAPNKLSLLCVTDNYLGTLRDAISSVAGPRQMLIRIAYLSSDAFMNDLIASLRRDRMSDFKERFRRVDVLILDDVQLLAGRERTQEEFFHTFNTLYDHRRQIVLTSDKVPKEIPDLEERLRNRFEWGLIADIQPPDVETRVAILEKKAEMENIPLTHDVALFL